MRSKGPYKPQGGKEFLKEPAVLNGSDKTCQKYTGVRIEYQKESRLQQGLCRPEAADRQR